VSEQRAPLMIEHSKFGESPLNRKKYDKFVFTSYSGPGTDRQNLWGKAPL
jgi:hypothetical protein